MHTAWRLLRIAAALLAVGFVAAPPAVAASSFTTLYNEYQSTGTIKACKHTAAELQAAKNQVPPDITQYSPDFPVALQAALEAHAHGNCGGAGSGGGAGSTGATLPGAAVSTANTGGPGAAAPAVSGTAPGATPAPLASPAGASPIATAALHAGGGGAPSVPAPLLALALIMVAAALAAICWTVVTLRGQSPHAASVGHTLGEVRVRVGDTLREFADWLRLGR